MGAALVVLGGIPDSIEAPVSISARHSPWKSIWFIIGFTIAGIGAAFILWALILYLAHQHAEGHYCPDPKAHLERPAEAISTVVPPPSTKLIASSELPVLDTQWLRSVFRTIKLDLNDSATRIVKAQREGRYWGSTSGILAENTWRKNRQRISGLAGVGDTYESLAIAFGHVKRINGMHLFRVFNGGNVRPDDNLAEALAAINAAEMAVEKQLAELG